MLKGKLGDENPKRVRTEAEQREAKLNDHRELILYY
jgi:hypothetical protein